MKDTHMLGLQALHKLCHSIMQSLNCTDDMCVK